MRYNSLIGFSYCLTGAWYNMRSLASVQAGSEGNVTGRLNDGGEGKERKGRVGNVQDTRC